MGSGGFSYRYLQGKQTADGKYNINEPHCVAQCMRRTNRKRIPGLRNYLNSINHRSKNLGNYATVPEFLFVADFR